VTAQQEVTPSGEIWVQDPRASRGARRIAIGYGVLLGGLLLGYMFMGRGFAHIGVGPVFIGDAVMIAGIVAAVVYLIHTRRVPQLNLTLGLLLAFVLLGAARTVPYLGTYGMDALRDGVLWGYAAFALIVYILVDRWSLLTGFRGYGWVVPIFALWLPINWYLFRLFSLDIDPNRPGDFVPLVFFKGGDMAVHVVGAVAFLIIGAREVRSWRTFAWRTVVFLPLLWTMFVAGTSNRGALVTSVIGLVAVALLAGRTRNWRPFLAAIGVAVAALTIQSVIAVVATDALPSSDPRPSATASMTPSSSPSSTATPTPAPTASAEPTGEAVTLVNGGFEQGLDATGAPVGWTPRGAEVTLVDEGGAGGSAFVSMHNPNARYEATLTSDRFSFEAGRDISVAAWATAIDGQASLEVYVNWFDGTGAFISNAFVKKLATDGDDAWRQFGGAVSAPPGTTLASITLFEATGDATLGIDDLNVRIGDFLSDTPAPAVAASALVNGGFDQGLDATGAPVGWTPRGAEVTLVDEGGDGSAYAEIENPLNGYEATIRSSRFAFSGGKDVRVTAFAKAVTGGPAVEIYVDWYDRSGELISSDFATKIVPEGRTAWLELSGAVRAPDGAAQAALRLFEARGLATFALDEVGVEIGDFGPTIQSGSGSSGRPPTVEQLIENIRSLFTDVPDPGLEGTKNFRLAWWGTIVDYTVFGEHFWTGKGFGVNLADDDGFQSTADGSLRAPHNSHLTVLARMGVPGFLLWVALQAAFAVGLLRALYASRLRGSTVLAGTAAWLLAYWVAMMIATSFDPYLEGPQGGIWYWVVIGAGLVVMRLTRQASTA